MPVISLDIVRAAGLDAGNRAKRRNGRAAWTRADYREASRDYLRLSIMAGSLPVECWEAHTGEPWPYEPDGRGWWRLATPRTS